MIMNLETLQKDMIAAMKAKEKLKKETISSLISAVKKAGIDSGDRENIPEELVNQTILKEVKTLQEQVDTCPAEREDLKEEYTQRLAIAKAYAPTLLSSEEVKEILEKDFVDVIASKNKGQIMKAVMPSLKGKADGKVINQVVGELCK